MRRAVHTGFVALLGALAVAVVVLPAGPAAAQQIPSALFDGSILPTGTSLEAAVGTVTGTVRREINNRLMDVQPVRLRIAWPINRISGVPSVLDAEGEGTRAANRFVMPNDAFQDHPSRDQVLALINATGPLPQTDDVRGLLADGAIGVETAARVLYNRWSVFQVLQSGGGTMTYRIRYSGLEEPDTVSVPTEALRWVFRTFPVQGVDPGTGLSLVAVDLVSDSIDVNLVRSGEGAEYLRSVTAVAEFVPREGFGVVRGAGTQVRLENPSAQAGAGPDRPLVVDFASQGVEHLMAGAGRLEEEGDVRIGVGLGVIAFTRDDPEQDSFTGLNVSAPLFGRSFPVQPGILAGLNTRRDLFLGPSLTLGNLLSLGWGWRSRESGDTSRNTHALVASLNVNELVGRAGEREPLPVTVRANAETLTRVSPDRSLMDATLSGLVLNLETGAGGPLVGRTVVLQPQPGTLGTPEATTGDTGTAIVFPAMPGGYEIERILTEAQPGVEGPCYDFDRAVPVVLTANRLTRRTLRVTILSDPPAGGVGCGTVVAEVLR